MHWVLSDCVMRAIAKGHQPACAESVHGVTCGDCREQMEDLQELWLQRYYDQHFEARMKVKRMLEEAERVRVEAAQLRELIAQLREAARTGDDPPPMIANERCPACREGVLATKMARGRPFLGCTRFPVCRYSANVSPPWSRASEGR